VNADQLAIAMVRLALEGSDGTQEGAVAALDALAALDIEDIVEEHQAAGRHPVFVSHSGSYSRWLE